MQKILGIDKLEMSPINGVSFYQEDIFDENIYKFLKDFLKQN